MKNQEVPWPATARPPWRQLVRLYLGSLVVIRLPYSILKALFYRPHPKWTFRQAILAHLLREGLHIIGVTGGLDNLTLDPGKEGERFEVMDPRQFPASLYQGPASSPAVAPAPVGGIWYPRKPESPRAPVILWIHGGAFAMCDARDGSFAAFTARALLEGGAAEAVFCLEYRLSGYGREGYHPFPAALQDAITAYAHLTGPLGIPPASLTVGGDSAGANLAVALLRYIARDEANVASGGSSSSTGLRRPGAAVVVSPWVDPLSCLGPSYRHEALKGYRTDYIPASFLQWGAATYYPWTPPPDAANGNGNGNGTIDGGDGGGGGGGGDSSSSSIMPYITPIGHPFATGVPLFVSFGECEMFAPGVAAWAQEMRGVPGNEVELFCDESAPHDTLTAGEVCGWEENAHAVAARIAGFVRAHRSRGSALA